jgi:uncharacterized membrane protein
LDSIYRLTVGIIKNYDFDSIWQILLIFVNFELNYLFLTLRFTICVLRTANLFIPYSEVMFNTAHFHPMIVHFPIALITVGFLADVVRLFFKNEKWLSKAGYYLMLLGALSAVAAWSTGQLFTTEPVQGEIVKVFTRHESAAMATMIFMVAGSVFRIWLVSKKREETQLKWIAFVLYFLAFAAVTYTGFMGGTMVYNYMMTI